jgi:hypothetical protein
VPDDLPTLIDAYAAGEISPYRLAWAIGLACHDQREGLAFVRHGKAYAVDSLGHLVVRTAIIWTADREGVAACEMAGRSESKGEQP